MAAQSAACDGGSVSRGIWSSEEMLVALSQLKAEVKALAHLLDAAAEEDQVIRCPYGCEDGLIYGEEKRAYGNTIKLRADVKPCPLHAGAV